MKLRRFNRWILWLLPLLAARALIPVGFMLSAESGTLQIVLCSGSGPVAVAPFASSGHEHHHLPGSEGHAHHHDGGHAESQHHHSGTGAHETSVCPFALAGMAYLPGHASAIFHLPAFVAAPVDLYSSRVLFSHPVLIDRIRGPPWV
jgi:hypothetical protein